MKLNRELIALFFATLLPWGVFAEAPVVDESENFAILDQNAAADEQPLAKDKLAFNDRQYPTQEIDREYHDEQPLARDTHSSKNNNGTLLNELQSLKQEVQELRGQLEMQAHELSTLKEQQLAFYKDLDGRIRGSTAPESKIQQSEVHSQPSLTTPKIKPEKTPKKVIPITTITPNANGNNNPAEEQIRYLAAYDLIKNKRFEEAISAMNSFTEQYPKGGYTANAHYWLGELYMTQRDFPQAISHFNTVLEQFPSSSKSAPSLLKVGYALAASGNTQDAVTKLNEVIKRYPDTQTAKLAQEKLSMLGR